MRYSEFQRLTEDKAREVNLAQRLKKQLSSASRNAIDTWEMMNWVNGDLSTAYSEKNSVYQEIEQAAEILRKVIRSREGKTVTLYRGLHQSDDADRHANRALYSWTTRAKIAALFAGLARMGPENQIQLNRDRKTANQFLLSLTDEEANQIQDTVIRNGKAKWKNLYFIPSPYNSEYTDILRKINGRFSHMSDERHSDIAQWLIQTREEEKQFNQEVKSQGKDTGYVVQKNIPVDDIVWVLNAAGSMEYIVKSHSGLEAKRVEI